MSTFLFNDFNPVSAKQWKQKIQVDLKGKDYIETLVWKNTEGIDVKPFYTTEDTQEVITVDTPSTWHITQHITVHNDTEANTQAKEALQKGAEAIVFTLPNDDVDVCTLLNGLHKATIYLQPQFLSVAFAKKVNDCAQKEKYSIYLSTDIVHQLAKTGNWYSSLTKDHETLDAILANTQALQSSLSVNLGLYQNAGANCTQQLAYALAHCNEYLNHLATTKTTVKTITFQVAVGANYFFEIAKLRALRILFNSLLAAYDANIACHIVAIPTHRNKTLYDYNVNMLRTTTETMSAVLGGANSVVNLPYDTLYHHDNEFSTRIARNQLLLLKEESYFDTVSNPVDGNYYVETLTKQLSEKALVLFKDIEKSGGFLTQLKSHTIQKKIKEAAKKEQDLFDAEVLVLIGTNKYPNAQDKMKHDLEINPFTPKKARKTLIEPIIPKRLAAAVEQKRLDNE